MLCQYFFIFNELVKHFSTSLLIFTIIKKDFGFIYLNLVRIVTAA